MNGIFNCLNLAHNYNIANKQGDLLKTSFLEHGLENFCAKTNKRGSPNKSGGWNFFDN